MAVRPAVKWDAGNVHARVSELALDVEFDVPHCSAKPRVRGNSWRMVKTACKLVELQQKPFNH